MTPWQFRVAMKASLRKAEMDHDRSAWHMWHTAMLSGVTGKKFPPLKKFLSSSQKPVDGYNRIDENALKAGLKAYSERWKKKHGHSSPS